MKKEEVLEKSREENKKKDVYELEVAYKGGTIAAVMMLLVACVYFIYEITIGKGSNPAFYSLIAIFNATFYGYRAVKLNKGRALNICNLIVWGVLTIILITSYFTDNK